VIKVRAPGSKPIKLAPVRPSAAEAAWYRSQLLGLIDAMHKSVLYWVQASWRKAGLAMDADPHKILDAAMNKLGKQWQATFKSESKRIADGFMNGSLRHHDTAFTSSLRKAGVSVRFQSNKKIEAALDGGMAENVALITSIPEEYMEHVSKAIRESVDAGRNMKQLTRDLEHAHGITRNRARLIARDQNNKATAIIHRIRQKQVGIKKAVWIHTTASKTPREEHAQWGDEGAEYDIDKGMFSEEDGEYVWPGTPINCGCTCMSIVPGSDEDETEEEE